MSTPNEFEATFNEGETPAVKTTVDSLKEQRAASDKASGDEFATAWHAEPDGNAADDAAANKGDQ